MQRSLFTQSIRTTWRRRRFMLTSMKSLHPMCCCHISLKLLNEHTERTNIELDQAEETAGGNERFEWCVCEYYR